MKQRQGDLVAGHSNPDRRVKVWGLSGEKPPCTLLAPGPGACKNLSLAKYSRSSHLNYTSVGTKSGDLSMADQNCDGISRDRSGMTLWMSHRLSEIAHWIHLVKPNQPTLLFNLPIFSFYSALISKHRKLFSTTVYTKPLAISIIAHALLKHPSQSSPTSVREVMFSKLVDKRCQLGSIPGPDRRPRRSEFSVTFLRNSRKYGLGPHRGHPSEVDNCTYTLSF